jgi:DNA-binding PadR family transcriptional regulator
VDVRDRQQIDTLLLAVAAKEPASGREFIERVRKGSDGVFVLPLRTVYHELHRLTKDRLIEVMWHGGARRYRLTQLGERILATRRRQWVAFARGFHGMLEETDGESR